MLLLNKTVGIPIMIIAIIMKITNIMDKFFLDECLYKIYKCYTMIELKFLKELILIKQVHQKSDICYYWYFFNYSFKFQPNVCNRCHDSLIISVSLSDITVLNIKGSLYCFIISLISKIQAKGLMQNADLTEKTGIL